jgi:F-type H+-transporting ATPase subunit delta
MAGELTLAKRYARALLELGVGADDVGRVQKDLYGVEELWEASPELRTLIGTPRTSKEQKRRILQTLLTGKIAPLTLNFLYLLVDKSRFRLLGTIAACYDELNDEIRSVAKAKVRSYMPLTKAQRTKLVEKLQRFTERSTIELDEAVDADLLGGIVVEIGAYVLDGSVRGRLRKLRDHLLLREEQRAQQAAAMGAQAFASAN